MKSFGRLVVPVDGSSAARRGIDLARREGAAADVGTVVDEIALILPLAEGALYDPSLIMDTIEHAADDNVNVALAPLRAAGTHGRGELGRLLFGSVADEVVRTARVPIYVVHHQRRAASVTPWSERPHARPSKIRALSGPPRNELRT